MTLINKGVNKCVSSKTHTLLFTQERSCSHDLQGLRILLRRIPLFKEKGNEEGKKKREKKGIKGPKLIKENKKKTKSTSEKSWILT